MLQVAGEAFNDSPDAFNRRLIDAVPITVVVCDRDGALVRANARTAELLGRAAAPGEQFRDVVRLSDADGSPLAEENCPVSLVLRTETPTDQSLCLERADGSRVAVRVTAEPLRDQHDSTIGAIITIQDAAADTHRATLAAIVDSSDDAIVSKTLDGVVTSWNRGAERIFGYTAEEAVGRHISLIIPTDRLAEESEVLARLRRGERIDHFETVRRTKSGRPIDVSLTVSPVLSSGGRIIGASKVARDITERNSTHRALGRSQRRYRRLFDSAGVSLWELDFSAVKSAIDDVRRRNDVTFREYLGLHPEFVTHCVELIRVVDVNQTTLQMFGARTQSDLLRGLGRIVDESTLAVFADGLAAIAEGRTVFEGEVALLTLAGARLDAMLSLRFPQGENPRDPDGSFDSVLVSLTDITERRKAEDKVRGEIQIRETLANVGASLAAELDPDRLVQAVTDAATHLTSAETGAFFYNVTNDSGESYQLHALAGASLADVGPDSSALAPPLFAQAFRDEAIVRIDDVTKEPRPVVTGSNAPAPGRSPIRSYLSVPVVSRSREVLGGLVFGHSRPGMFTARHEQLAAGIASWAALALDNARLYKAAQDANATKDEFLATLSHELRTPLNAMLGWTHLLRSGTLAGNMHQRALEALERNGRAQAQLVDDLLDVSRIVSGRLQLRADDVELGAVIGSALETIRPGATAKDLHLRFEPPDAQVIVTGDADRLRQIFWNLLTNAVKFTPAHGHIDVDMRPVDAGIEVAVRDTGLGIGRDFLHHVFERFRQADSSHARRHGGLGLGLAIVRHLVEAHGGTVGVDSAGEGQGATFTVRLPVRSVRRPPRVLSGGEPRRRAALSGLHVLVVDDERDAREFLAALLLMHGAEVDLASSAGEALGIIANRRVDVLLADLGLPDRDGYALIQAIRSLDPRMGGAVPAVAVTAYAGLRERARAFEAGYGWHVAKPVDPDQLLSIVVAAAQSRPRTDGPDPG